MSSSKRRGDQRQLLIDLGIQFFSYKGFHGTGLKELLAAGNVPKGSFYNYFDSKEGFAAEVIEVHTDQTIQIFDEIAAAHAEKPPPERIRAVFAELQRIHEEAEWLRGCLLGNLAAEFSSNSPACASAIQAGVNKWLDRLEAEFAEGQQRGEVRTDLPASALAAQFWNAWQGATLEMQYQRSGAALGRTVDLMLDHFIASRNELATA